jgi:ABC-2 type transport system permease protein
MSAQPETTPYVVPPVMPPTRPLYWSVRREVWENRSTYIAPLIVMAVVLFGSALTLLAKPGSIRPFRMAPAPIMLTTFIVGFFYCLDALYGERRDRSILFWKSLPVSDRTTVLSKMAVPLVVLPLIAFVLSLITVIILLLVGTVSWAARSMNPGPLWAEMFFIQPMIMFYGLAAHALWFAPVHGWLLLISAWAKRAPVLWAILPPAVLAVLEHVLFRTKLVPAFLSDRFLGAMRVGFTNTKKTGGSIDVLSQLTPGRFLTTPGLWLGLIFAAACLAAAIRLRRNREPI